MSPSNRWGHAGLERGRDLTQVRQIYACGSARIGTQCSLTPGSLPQYCIFSCPCSIWEIFVENLLCARHPVRLWSVNPAQMLGGGLSASPGQSPFPHLSSQQTDIVFAVPKDIPPVPVHRKAFLAKHCHMTCKESENNKQRRNYRGHRCP